MYIHRVGRYSLTEDDPAWEKLEEPDSTGFRGLTSSTVVVCFREPRSFCAEGFRVPVQMPAKIEYRTMQSDVIAIDSEADSDAQRLHAAVMLQSEEHAAL